MNQTIEITWYDQPLTGAVVAIGNFDGVHKGHQQIITTAKDFNLPIVALTFDPHPASVVSPSQIPNELLPLSDRIKYLKMAGVTSVAVIKFTEAFSKLSPAEFVNEVLVEKLSASSVVIGSNFRFGNRAVGDVKFLQENLKIEVKAIDLEFELGKSVSSSRIRDAILGGNIEIARELLTRPHELSGLVIHGEKRGREIGYPTANLAIAPNATIPSDGVYAGWLTVENNKWPAAISIGTNPTFEGVRNRQVEAYALDQKDLDLYDKLAKVEFGWRLRDTIKFAGLDSLLAQMKIDCDKARELTQN
jgi:riboflavin kinase/FMN adenylyltransferase